MQHYVETKHSLLERLHTPRDDSLVLLYRVGDFFESFFEDAYTLSSVCEIALTSKDAGKALGTKVPMAGVPHYCVDEKIKLLIEKNLTVAVVDQVESAAQTQTGKLVKRAVTRLITPGTACDEALLQSNYSSYIASVVVRPARANDESSEMQCQFGFSYADVSTGEFKATDGSSFDQLQRLLATITPVEILLTIESDSGHFRSHVSSILNASSFAVVLHRQNTPLPDAERILAQLQQVDHVESLDCRTRPFCTQAASALIKYVQQMTVCKDQEHGGSPMPLSALHLFSPSQAMLLDAACLKNLEIIETVRDGVKERSLQWAIDRTTTSMGARCLRSWLLAPSSCLSLINQRQTVVQGLLWDENNTRQVLQNVMKNFADLERLGGRICTGRTTPREMRWLCESILQVPTILSLVWRCLENNVVEELTQNDNYINDVCSPVHDELITLARQVTDVIIDPAPSYVPSALAIQSGNISKENWDLGGTRIFRDGYNEQLDILRKKIREPQSWISMLEEQEKQRTSIETLRIKHIKSTGYVLRIPRSVGEKIMNEDPMYFSKLGYDRVQSTKAELRFRFKQLKDWELSHNFAFAEVLILELRLFEQLRNRLAEYVHDLRQLGRQIASIDVLAGFAEIAEEKGYVRPQMLPADTRILELEDARHPVVEQTLPIGKSYVPNSFHIGQSSLSNDMDLMILCGPNAAGKSCALRSIGLICIMAQSGCFVPARSATMSICDRIFTRVGAVDDLARGRSTFQVEMAETACILSNVTSTSLVLLDEIGRGTSTVDGVAIAWSVAEYLAKGVQNGSTRPRTVFVTHYHELNHLSSIYDNIGSYHLHVVQKKSSTLPKSTNVQGGGWVATHKVVEGPSFESLGLAIAERAGFPVEVMERARHIASLLHIPSKAIGAGLRSALIDDKGAADFATANNETNEILCEDRRQFAEASYEKGFNDGYTKALSELKAEFEDIFMKRL
ncbi:unnamed protein product [Agarophyton chilense]